MVKIVTENGIRFYLVDGQRYPSVTSILSILPKPRLEAWRAVTPDADKISAEAAVIGSASHFKILSKYSIRQLEPPSIYLPWKQERIEEWIEEIAYRCELAEMMWAELTRNIELEPLYVEHTMVSRKHRFAGTADLIGKINSINTLLDIKTGNEVYREYFIQLGAYNLLCKENGIDIEKGVIAHLPVNSEEIEGKLIWLKKEELSWYAAEFLTLLREFTRSEGIVVK